MDSVGVNSEQVVNLRFSLLYLPLFRSRRQTLEIGNRIGPLSTGTIFEAVLDFTPPDARSSLSE